MTNFRPTEEERSPMSETERRHAERGERTFPISVTIAAPIKIEGQSLDFSNSGVLFTAPGRISVNVGMTGGKQYRGRLVRAFPMDSGATAYGIELESPETEQHWAAHEAPL